MGIRTGFGSRTIIGIGIFSVAAMRAIPIADAAPAQRYRMIAQPDAQAFCQRFTKTVGADFDALIGGTSSGRLAMDIRKEALPSTDPESPTTSFTSIEGPLRAHDQPAKIAPGLKRRIVFWTGYSHYYDGDVIAFGDPADDLAMRKIDIRFDQRAIGEKTTTTAPLPKGWTLLSGGRAGIYPTVSPRYVHFTPSVFEGIVLLLASPVNRTVKPDAALISPDDHGGFRTLCAFQR